MRIDSEDLRRHYASLADEELAAIDANDLIEAAKAVYQAELARRGLPITREGEGRANPPAQNASLDRQGEVDETASAEEAGAPREFDLGPPPEWLEEAACACSFAVRRPNRGDSNDLHSALRACAIVRRAGIPCYLTTNQNETEDQNDPPAADPAVQSLVRLMVPGGLVLHATSVLDRKFFNEEKEEAWRNHFGELSDSELQALDPDVFCAGYLDLVARLRTAYEDEIARRQLTPRDTGSLGAVAGG